MNFIKSLKNDKIAWYFLLPSLILVAIFVIYPTVYSLDLSFYKWNGISQHKRFVGLANYQHLFKDRVLAGSILNTFYYVFFTMFLQGAIALILALFIEAEKNRILKIVYRVIFFFPSLIAVAMVALIWGYMYDGHTGLINKILGTSIFWLSNKHLVVPAIIIANIWQWTGFNAIVFSAGIVAIPRSLYEAAYLEGANPTQTFWNITFPLLRYTILIVLVTNMINGLKTYDIVKVLTDGGPNHASEFIATHIYSIAFEAKRIGRASAMGYALTIGTVILTIIYFKVSKAKDK